MKKILKIASNTVLGITGVVLGLVSIVSVYFMVSDLIDNKENGKGVTAEEVESHNEEQYINPFGNTIEQKDLSAHNFNEYIHRMSHHKVKAKAKWGFFEITNERIDWLLEGIDNTFARLNNEELYRDILERWDKGDFSQADKDHNAILKLRSGHGESEATGLLSPEEEREYIKNHSELSEVYPLKDFVVKESEYESFASWVEHTKELLIDDSYEQHANKNEYEHNLAYSINAYARYYGDKHLVNKPEDTKTISKLQKISGLSMKAGWEYNNNKRSELLKEINKLLDEL